MHTCKECRTVIETDNVDALPTLEMITITNLAGVVPCRRCIAIVVNLMTNESLMHSWAIPGWVTNG